MPCFYFGDGVSHPSEIRSDIDVVDVDDVDEAHMLCCTIVELWQYNQPTDVIMNTICLWGGHVDEED